ncbi:uncharacterized protein K460DRAFT_90828 [Cucurbitaria berberidis CBS 394.84]|uniref:Uncharacterized protein n=1 Tax=Cucurbitaria berberidis CBS 394.84 TaxID=1168544 RepID=A0A9P4LC80_9PLEO|nr:uncharacterized protein K460DRAFT_90828 [Cucurbitaria berberidis CBS 394.84]KAF1849428.1 hypothetical protein K460DRAFT_90828 [Cucurbitaria berberidis CBS 394.84]
MSRQRFRSAKWVDARSRFPVSPRHSTPNQSRPGYTDARLGYGRPIRAAWLLNVCASILPPLQLSPSFLFVYDVLVLCTRSTLPSSLQTSRPLSRFRKPLKVRPTWLPQRNDAFHRATLFLESLNHFQR